MLLGILEIAAGLFVLLKARWICIWGPDLGSVKRVLLRRRSETVAGLGRRALASQNGAVQSHRENSLGVVSIT